MVAVIASGALMLRIATLKWFRWKMATGKFDIRRPNPRPPVADPWGARIQSIQDGPDGVRVEQAEREPHHVAIFLAKSGRNLAARKP